MVLLVATQNKKKLKEIREILCDLGARLVSCADFSKAPRIVENGGTFRENAVKKAVAGARFFKRLTMGEDSGLCVDALDGSPGIYSARFAGGDKDDLRNNLKVLRLMKDVPLKRRAARYVCAVALADEHGVIGVVEGVCRGRIGFQMRGASGFGYDPLFVIPKYGKTFAELGEEIKHTMSHRFRALRKIRGIIGKYIEAHKTD